MALPLNSPNIAVSGSVPAGTAPTDFPIMMGGSDGNGFARLLQTDAIGHLQMLGPTLDGSALGSVFPVVVGGSDGTNARYIFANAAHQLAVMTEGQKNTYRLAVSGLVGVASATDVLTLSGNASNIVRVTRVWISGTSAVAAAMWNISLIKRSTADTGGTSTTPTPVILDSTDPVAVSVVNAYTANPAALGTVVGGNGIVANALYLAQLTGTLTTGVQPVLEFKFGDANGSCLVLRGVAQQLCVNMNGPTNAQALNIGIEWTEGV